MFERILKIAIENPQMFLASFMPVILLFIANNYKDYLTRSTRFLSLFLIVFFISDLPLWITSGLKLNNLKYYYFRDALLSIMMASLYFIGNKKDKFALKVVIAIISVVLVLQLFDIIPLGEFIWINRMLLAGTSIFYFFRLLQNPKIKDIIYFPFFWINSGILFYNLGTLMITFFYKYSIKAFSSKEKYFGNLAESVTIVAMIFFGIGLMVTKRNFEARKL